VDLDRARGDSPSTVRFRVDVERTLRAGDDSGVVSDGKSASELAEPGRSDPSDGEDASMRLHSCLDC
jgi:hypothetical protein